MKFGILIMVSILLTTVNSFAQSGTNSSQDIRDVRSRSNRITRTTITSDDKSKPVNIDQSQLDSLNRGEAKKEELPNPYNELANRSDMADPNVYYSASMGALVPIGSFSKDSLGDDGFAKTGYLFEMAVHYRLSSRWNISAKLRYTLNPIDEDKYADMLKSRAPQEIYDYISDLDNTKLIRLQTDYWSGISILPGIAYECPFKNVKFMFRAEGGAMYGYSSAHEYRIRDTTESEKIYEYTESMTSGTKFAPAYGGSAGVRFRVKKLQMQSNIHYFHSQYDVSYSQGVNLAADSDSGSKELNTGSNSIEVDNLALSIGLFF